MKDYVVKPLEAQLLIRKLRKVLFNKDFIKWEIPENEEITLIGTFPATVIALGETGYSLVGPFKLSPNRDVKPTIPALSETSINECHQRSSSIVKSFSGGLFLNDVTFVGAGENNTSKIRQFLSKRGQE